MNNTPLRRFWSLLKLFKIEIRHIYVYAVFHGFVNLTLPLGIQAIITFLQNGELTSTWILLVAFVLLGIAVTGIMQVLQLRLVENIQQNLYARSAFEFAFRLPKIRMSLLDKVHAPELANRFFDTMNIQKGLPKILIDFSLSMFQIIFGLILLAIYSPYFIVLGLVLGTVSWLIFKYTGPVGLKTSLQESSNKYKMAHWLEEIARINRTIKLQANNDFHLRQTDHLVSDYVLTRENHFKVLLKQFKLFIVFKVLLAAGLLVLGGLLVFQQQMNIGQFVAAEIIIILILNSVEKVIVSIDTVYDVLTSLEKIGIVTDLDLEENPGTGVIETNKGLTLRSQGIYFKYPDQRNYILEDLSFNIAENDVVLLNGKSGSGKTSLIRVLAGLQEVTEGEIYINNIPLSNLNKDSYSAHLGLVLPINQIFEGSIRQNILLGRDIPENKLQRIVQLLDLDHFILQQIQGIDSFVDSAGRRLPRSVIERIQLARILIGEPKLLLLEDPLQFTEEKLKQKIIDFICHPDRSWTVLVISDYPYWRIKSNRSLFLDNQMN